MNGLEFYLIYTRYQMPSAKVTCKAGVIFTLASDYMSCKQKVIRISSEVLKLFVCFNSADVVAGVRFLKIKCNVFGC